MCFEADFPDNGYISVNFDYVEEGSSVAMVKIDGEDSLYKQNQLNGFPEGRRGIFHNIAKKKLLKGEIFSKKAKM